MRKIPFRCLLVFLMFSGCMRVQQPNMEKEILDPIPATIADIVRQFKIHLPPSPNLTLAVVEFTDYEGRVTDLGVALANQLIDILFKNNYRVLERIELAKVIYELKLGNTGLLDSKTASQIGHFYGANAVVLGLIERGQKQYRVVARAVDTNSGEVIASATAYLRQTTEVLVMRQRIRTTIRQIDALPTRKPGNLLLNGDFSQPWRVGWKRRMANLRSGSTKVSVESLTAMGGNALHILHKGKNRIEFSQEIEVAGPELVFSASFQMKSWEGMFIGFSGTGMASISLIYLNQKGRPVGATHLVNYVRNIFADTPLIGVPRGPTDTQAVHHIKIENNKFYQDYRIDLLEEISNNLMAVDPSKIRKIRVIIAAGANDPNAGCELYVGKLSLSYK